MLMFLYYQDENEVTAVHLHTSPLISDETYTIYEVDNVIVNLAVPILHCRH